MFVGVRGGGVYGSFNGFSSESMKNLCYCH